MALHLSRWNQDLDGPPTEGKLTARMAREGYGVTRHCYPPGSVFPAHSHGVDKLDVVLSGHFRMRVDGESVLLGPGDCIYIPARMVHSALVEGDKAVTSLDGLRCS